MSRVLTAEEVALELRVSRRLVYAMVRRGELQGVKVGRLVRIPSVALEDYLHVERLLGREPGDRRPWQT